MPKSSVFSSKIKIIYNVPEHTQIIFFKSGHKKSIRNVIRIDEGEMLLLTTISGKEFLINKNEVELVERYYEDKN